MSKITKSKSTKRRLKVKKLSGTKKKVSAKELKDVKGGEGTHALYQDIVIPPAAGLKTGGSR
jgi:hypothetical protein